ncbi:MAG: beta-glucosidase [Alistipes sp.]|nr:beta-glucosidase [Alistipes sp.]
MKRLFQFIIAAFIASGACSKAEPSAPSGDGGSAVDFADSGHYAPAAQATLLEKTAHDYFRYYWDECHPVSYMARIGTSRPANTVALAGSAYAVTALPVAVERGWITYAQGAERFAEVCRFLDRAERYHGAWSHWMNGTTGQGLPFNASQQSAGDLVETAFMMMGLLVCSEYFDRGGSDEAEAIALTEKFWGEIEWNFYTNGGDTLCWAWDKELGFAPLKITGPNEALPVYLLALAAPAEHAVPASLFDTGWRGGARYYNSGRTTYGYRFELGAAAQGGPLFTTQHPFLWLDPARLQDDYADYWEVCTHHALINRHYCLNEAPRTYGYDAGNWGLSACYGPSPKNYKGRSPSNDDGVLCTTAAIGAIAQTPYYALQALRSINARPELNGIYGPVDSYSPVDGWQDDRYLSINVMPVVSIIENYRSGLIWRLAMRNAKIIRGLELAGFSAPRYAEGFCQMPVNSVDATADLAAHPDRGCYRLHFWSDTDGASASLELLADDGRTVRTDMPQTISRGINTVEIPYEDIAKGSYEAILQIGNRTKNTLKIRLR